MAMRDLSQEFEKVMGWLSFETPPSAYEMNTLRASFDAVATGEIALMVVSSGYTNVTASIFGAFCTDVPEGQEDWFRSTPMDRKGVCFNRDGFFLANALNDQDPIESIRQIDNFFKHFSRTSPDRRFEFPGTSL